MCGIVGIAGDLIFSSEAQMKKMLIFDYVRGVDSTGFAAISNSDVAKIAKISSHPIDLFQMGSFKDALSYNTSKVFLGHNRAATRGGVTTFNAHPFEVDHIVGVHNGTLTTETTKRLETMCGETFSVDSLALFTAIAKFGAEKVIPLCDIGTTPSDGAWSLVWYDKEAKKLFFLRNKHRPMWYGWSEDYKRLYWASEHPIIEAGIKVGETVAPTIASDKDGYGYFATEVDMLYEFDVALIKEGGTLKKHHKPKVTKLAGKEPTPVASYTPAKDDPFERNGTIGMGFRPTTTGGQSQTSQDVSRGKQFLHLKATNDNPLAGIMTKEAFESVAKNGCQWCKGPIDIEDEGLVLIDKDDIFFCSSCAGGGAFTRIYVKPEVINAYA